MKDVYPEGEEGETSQKATYYTNNYFSENGQQKEGRGQKKLRQHYLWMIHSIIM